MTASTKISGYTYGKAPHSPVALDDLQKLEATAAFTQEDRRALRELAALLTLEAEALVDGWRKIIASQQHLSQWFFGRMENPTIAIKRR